MRHRAAMLRRRLPFANLQLGGVRTIHQRRRRAFTKRQDEDGSIYYTVASKEESKDMPKQLDADTLFEMPDLVLDLDAAGERHVREATGQDEEQQAKKWNVSEKRTAVKERMQQLSVALGHSRSNALKMTFKPTHPMHITDQDIMSAALRGMVESEKGAEPSQEEEEGSSNRVVINALTQRHHDLTEGQLPAAARRAASQDTVESDGVESGLENLMKLGDPRRRPDYMKQLRVLNGIPGSAMKEDEKLIRWLLLRHHNNTYVKTKLGGDPPSAADVAAAIREEEPMRRNILNIRRIVSRSLSLGSDLWTIETGSGKDRVNVPREIRDACARILDTFADNYPPHYEVLTFANNLSQRMPNNEGDMGACVYGLQLRSLAGLGLIDLTMRHLEWMRADLWNGEVNILSDVKAALHSWMLGLKENSVLQTPEARQQLFRALTGLGDPKAPLSHSYRSLLFDFKMKNNKTSQTAHLEALGQYLELLGQLGAVNMLHTEWTKLNRSWKVASEDGTGLSESESTEMTDIFQQARKEAVEIAGVRDSSNSTEGLSLEESATLDYLAIGNREVS